MKQTEEKEKGGRKRNAGEPLAPPPYGYVKDPENKKKWIIDPDAAEVVQRVFRLCIEGNGNETIARILQDDKVLVPQAYWQSKGMSRGGKKTQPNPYKWCKTTIAKMLEQQEYCGDIINFKSYSKSFRNKTRVENPKENWAIFKDVHAPITDTKASNPVKLHPSTATRSGWSLPRDYGVISTKCLSQAIEITSICTTTLFSIALASRMVKSSIVRRITTTR